MADDTEEIDPSLDSLLNKYGASRRSVHAAENSEPSRGDNEEVHRVEQPSQFLQEIRERAEILSRNAAKARKVALQNVVNDDSKSLRSTSANSSLDMFVDVIRSANIAGENTISSLSVPSEGEDFISSDDLLQPILPLDAAPWSAESPRDSGRPWDIEGSLDTGGPWRSMGLEGSQVIESPWGIDGSRTAEVPWKCESAWRTDDGRDVVESKEIEGPWKANNPQGMEGAWNTENNDSLGDYGLSTEPWGTSTSQINDDITESEDSDTTSEESSDSQDDVDGSQGNISINSTQNANSLTLDREQDELASYERRDNVVEHRDDDTSLVWNLKIYSPPSSQTENADVESEDLWSNTAVVDEEEEDDNEEDEDELEDDDNNDDVNSDRVKNESISTRTRGEFTDTLSSVILAHTCDSDLVVSSPNHSNERFNRQIDDKMSLNDGIKVVNEFDDRMICVDLTRSEVQVDTMRETQTVSAKEDSLNDEDQSLCLIGKNIWKNIQEDEGQGARLCDEVMDHQLTTEIMGATLVEHSQDVCESSDAVEEEGDKDDSVEVYSTDITAVAETDDCINLDGIGSQIGAITEEMDGGTEQFHSNLKLSFDTNQSDSTSNVTDNLSSLYSEYDGNVSVEINVKDDVDEVKKASSLHVEHPTCSDPLLPMTDVSFSANDDYEICVRNRDEMEETTNRFPLSPQPQHPSASNHYDLLLPSVRDITSTVQDSNDGSIQDEMGKSTRYHSLHPQNSSASMESDTPLMDSSSSVFGNNDGNILDVSLEEDVKTEVVVDKATLGSHPLCSELLSALGQDDSESHVTASSSIDDDIIHVDVRTDLDKGRHDVSKERELRLHPELSSNTDKDETLLEEAPASDKKQYMDDCHKDEPDEGRKDADEVRFKIQSQTKLSLIPKSADVLGKDVSAVEDSKESPEAQVSADEDSKESPEAQVSADEDSKESPEAQVSADEDSKESPEEQVSADEDSKESPEEQAGCLVKRRSLGDGFKGRDKETGNAGHNSSLSFCIQQQSFRDERTVHDETLPHGNISCTQSLSLESMNDKGDPIMEVARAVTGTKCDFTTSKTVGYNTNNSNVKNSGQENLRDVHNIMLQKNFEEDASYHSKFRQSTKSVNLRTPNWEQRPINRDFTQDDLHNQTEGIVLTKDMLSSCSSGTTSDSHKENLKMSEKQVISSYGKPSDQDIVTVVKADYKTEKQEPKKVREGRHPEGLERSQKVNQHKSQSVGVHTKHGISCSREASSASSGCQSTLMNQDTYTEDLKSRESSSEQRGINPEGEDEGVRAGNVRNLIARFNSGSVLASDSLGSEMRRCSGGVSGLDSRVTARLTSMEDAHEDRPSMHNESSEAEMETVNQVIPWMQELAKRRKRRGHSSVWEKLTRQMSDK